MTLLLSVVLVLKRLFYQKRKICCRYGIYIWQHAARYHCPLFRAVPTGGHLTSEEQYDVQDIIKIPREGKSGFPIFVTMSYK